MVTRVKFPCSVGDRVWMVFGYDKAIYDYTDRVHRHGVQEYEVTNMGYSINKRKEVKTNIRLCLVVDNKTHDNQWNFDLEKFCQRTYSKKEIAESKWREMIHGN